ncbi:MAG: Flp/Fap pilin component [Actinomycetota bacterium]|nr:Flp/Fap pilin component [Actinomycetota bacterium]
MLAILLFIKDRFAVLRTVGERGAAAVEYGLLVALIAVAIIGAVFLLGGRINNTYTCVGNAMPAGSPSPTVTSC